MMTTMMVIMTTKMKVIKTRCRKEQEQKENHQEKAALCCRWFQALRPLLVMMMMGEQGDAVTGVVFEEAK